MKKVPCLLHSLITTLHLPSLTMYCIYLSTFKTKSNNASIIGKQLFCVKTVRNNETSGYIDKHILVELWLH